MDNMFNKGCSFSKSDTNDLKGTLG